MLRWSRLIDPLADSDEEGSAALEFILVGVIMLVPLVYLILTLGSIQHQALGVQTGARHLARALATVQNTEQVAERSHRVMDAIVEEYGMNPDAVDVSLQCRPAGAACPAPGALLVVTVRSEVTLPLIPDVFGLDRLATVPVEATTVHRVSQFRWTS